MEYDIIVKQSPLRNNTYNSILERIDQVLGNLLWTCNIKDTYAEENDPWLVILTAEDFSIRSTTNRLKVIVRVNEYLAVI